MTDVHETTDLSLAPLRTKGLQIVRGFFTGEARESLLRRGREVVEGVADGRAQRSGQFALGFDMSWFAPVFSDARLLDLVANALGPDLCILSWRILMKDHHFSGPINVHQDWPYFGGDTRKLNVFIPLTPVNQENGGLVFYERSHLYGPLERGDIDVQRHGGGMTQFCPDLDVGDVLLGDFLTWHYSAPSKKPLDRIMFQLIYQPANDPSSRHLLRGERSNPFVAPDRYSCLSEPLSLMNVGAARSSLEAGDVERAERFARGMLASDEHHVGAALLLADVLEMKGDALGAQAERAAARTSLIALSAKLEGAAPPSESAQPEPAASELAEIKSSQSWRWPRPFRRR